ncbi:agmatinase [Ascidiimonas sp. W6]|uniref:agmatinase n=1 Tax=Ascidiimonas meishanensis TaxID=3128903 RepID=UPI0030ECF192
MNKKILLQGILFDEKSSYLQGPSEAPPIIREYLHSGASNYYAENGIEITSTLYDDIGDFEITAYDEIEKITTENLEKGNLLFTLGGDHSITYPVLKALHAKHKKFQILHIDAHADLYDNFEGDPYSHACPFARIMQDKLASHLTQIGVRTLNPHQREQAKKYGVEIQEMKDFDPTKIKLKDMPLYISLDIDAFDPAYAPGVSHHEPGGLSPRQVIDLLSQIKLPIIGADIVEYNPKRDLNGITAALCAKMMREMMALIIQNKL